MHQLTVLGPAGEYSSRSRTLISDVRGAPVAELSLASVPFVSRAMSALRKAKPLGLDERLSALARAGEIFRTDSVEFEETVSRVSGLGISTVRAAVDKIARYCADAYEHAQFARPMAAVESLDDPRSKTGTAVWVRRGEVFAVHAAGNHPAVHADWIQALALGYRVAVRPSRREPFTAYGLVSALRSAGFGDDHVVYLPSEYAAADEMLQGADRAMVYGGDDVIRKYGSREAVLPQGPGRSKILITSEIDWHAHVDLIADSVSRGGGTSCVNATAVFVDGDAVAVAEAVAERLASIPSLPPEDNAAILPVQPIDSARQMEQYALEAARGTTAVLGGDGIVDELGDGSAALRPGVFLAPEPTTAHTRVELPFPCVWVAPWSTLTGFEPLRETLALTALTTVEDLIQRLLAEPTIRNLHVGPHPTYWTAPGMPHDGFLADFLMESKGLVRARSWSPPAHP
ncbi:aldehyde dehydrogenase family protein [Kribbella qitaiheensis]|uniref:aldehyde dehydrogenase family protein n=1 Tax=Kribbella qitaiheensis TaxID=1544730 RepID=UPI00361BF7A0